MAIRLTQLVLECADPQSLAAFWRGLLDLGPAEDAGDWVTLTWPGVGRLACHRAEGYQAPSWPGDGGEQQVHIDLLVDDFEESDRLARALGAQALSEVLDPGPKAWRVYADPAGHPFCLVSVPE